MEDLHLRATEQQSHEKERCIICLRKVRWKESDPRNERGDHPNEGKGASSPEAASDDLMTSSEFLRTCNGILTILRNKTDVNSSGSGDDEGISLETVIAEGLQLKTTFPVAPTLCQRCCDKVICVEKMIKAVRQLVREIRMLWEESRWKDGRLEEFEIEREAVKSGRETIRETDMECDEDFPNSLDNHSESAVDEDEEDVSNWHSEDNGDDPDYIKSEQEDDEVTTGDEDEEPMPFDKLIVDKEVPSTSLKVIPEEPDPLATTSYSCPYKNCCKTFTNYKKLKNHKITFHFKEESTSKQFLQDFSSKKQFKSILQCEVPGCRRIVYSVRGLSIHKSKCHPIKTEAPLPDKEKNFLCDFPNCGRRFSVKNALTHHKVRTHPEDTNGKFVCSCGKTFARRKGREHHIRTNKKLHPDYIPFRDNRQICDLCGEWVMYSDIFEHLTDEHLNGQAEWVMRCPNEKCRYLCVTNNAFNKHTHRDKTDVCSRIWRENGGPICDICGFKGTNMLKISNHVRDSHEKGKEKKFSCPISGCGKMFYIKQSMKYHLDEHDRRSRQIPEQICDKCGKSLKVEEMEGHLKEEHGIEEVIGCGQCEMKFSGRDEMVEHLYEHRVVGILCDICEVDKFTRYVDFREHYFMVHQLFPKKYKCEEGDCDTWFWRKEIRKYHELRAHKQKGEVGGGGQIKNVMKSKCDLCDYESVQEEGLMKHKIRVHGADPFRCDICGHTFDDKKIFQKHKKEHAGIPVQKEWRCEVEGCGRIFKKKNLWKHHVEIGHTGQRPHVCEICGKGFTLAASLRKHRESVHLKLRPCVCEECGERFATSGILKMHQRIHSGERKFGCGICGQRFRHKGVLKTHLEGHEKKGTDFKPSGPMKQIRKRKVQENIL